MRIVGTSRATADPAGRRRRPPLERRLAAAATVPLIALIALIAVMGPGASAAHAAAAPAGAVASRYTLPLPQAAVVAGFDAAATPYGPGHRGVDLLSAQGATVRAAAAGVVSFAGPVAGRSLVVVQHPDGVRTTYEPVDPAVAEGAAVAQGQVLGAVAGTHGGRDDVLHWGARRADAYIDPLRLLRPLGVVRLVPFR